jgi:hypothetical protein
MIAAFRTVYSESATTAAGLFSAKAVAFLLYAGIPQAILSALFGVKDEFDEDEENQLLRWMGVLIALFAIFLTCAWLLALGVYTFKG